MLNYECKVESKSPVRRELTISIPPKAIQEYMEKQFENLQKTAKIKGFRKGKVPLKILKHYYLEDVKSDVFSKLIRESYLRALEENKLLAVGTPEFETKSGMALDDGQSLTFTAKIEIMPEFDLKDVKKIKLKRKASKVAKEDVQKALDRLRDSRAEMVPSPDHNAPAKTGDFVEVSFSGAIDGKALPNLKAENRLVEIGGKYYMDAFEDALIGMKVGESKEFKLPFPETFPDKELASREAQMSVTVHEFKRKQLPVLDDEFAKNYKIETLKELETKIEESIKEEREGEVQSELREELLKELIQLHSFEVPHSLVESQFNYIIEQQRSGKVSGEQEKSLRALAENQVRASLILQKIAQEQKIRVEKADIEHEYSSVAQRTKMAIPEIQKMYESNQQAMRNLEYRIKENRTIDYLLGQVNISEAS